MSDTSPYQTPLPQGPSMPPLLPIKPPVVNVLGILHLVFAGFGALGAIWGLFATFLAKWFYQAASVPGVQEQMQVQGKLNAVTVVSSILSLLVTVPMVIAGIQLLKGHRNGLKWSNRYACSSLAARVVNILLSGIIVIPAMREMADGMIKSGPASPVSNDLMSVFMAAGAIGGQVFACIYPVLTLILLNRPAVKAWFATRAVNEA